MDKPVHVLKYSNLKDLRYSEKDVAASMLPQDSLHQS